MTRRGVLLTMVLMAWCSLQLAAQESTIYISVVAQKSFTVGSANGRTGIYFQHPSDDTAWGHCGPSNIRAFGVAVHPGTNQQVIYIASGNGLHKSSDGGATWRITTGWRITEVQYVCPDPRDVNTVYLACAYGVFRTSDGCMTWKECNAGLSSTFVTCVLVDNMRPGLVYCATEGGAYSSTNSGSTWTRMNLSVAGVRTIAQNPKEPDVLMVGTEENGIYRTTNGGKWWTKCEAGIDHPTFYTIAYDPQNPSTVYAAGYVTGVYKSTNNGERWNRVNNGLSVLTFHSLAVDPRNSGRVYAAAYWGGVFRTDDGGASWRRTGLADSQVWNVTIHP
jgi:photosystem II stability/assembly factor-like uncharacterized protein